MCLNDSPINVLKGKPRDSPLHVIFRKLKEDSRRGSGRVKIPTILMAEIPSSLWTHPSRRLVIMTSARGTTKSMDMSTVEVVNCLIRISTRRSFLSICWDATWTSSALSLDAECSHLRCFFSCGRKRDLSLGGKSESYKVGGRSKKFRWVRAVELTSFASGDDPQRVWVLKKGRKKGEWKG